MDEFGYRYLVVTRLLRSIALIYSGIAMPLYLLALHVRLAYIGLVLLAVMAFGMALSLSLGMLGDRKGYKYSLIIGEIVAFAGIALVAAASNIYIIVLGMILGGLSGGGGAVRGSMSSGLTAFIANNWKDDRERARKLAGLFVVGGAGSVIGSALLYFNSPLGAALGNVGAFRLLFAASSSMLLISAVLLIFVHDTKRPKKTTRIMKHESMKYSLKVIASNSVAGMGIGIAIPLMPLWFALSFKLSTSELSYIFILYYAIAGIGSFVARRISHKFDQVEMGAATRVAGGTLLVLMALSPFAIPAAAFYELYGFMSALGVPSRVAVNVKGVHKEDYGTASTMQGVAMNASQLTSGLSGYIMEYALTAPPLIGGVFQVAGGFVYRKLMKSRGDAR